MRGSAARLPTLAIAALLFVAGPASRPGSPGFGLTSPSDRAESLAVLPFGEAPFTFFMARLTVGELLRGIERFRPLPPTMALAVLGCMLSGALLWLSPPRSRGSRRLLWRVWRLAGPRAPPLQLA